MQKGKFIVFEGPDGSGKTTVAERIHQWMNEDLKKPTALAKSPGGTKFANALRGIAFAGMTNSHQAEAMAMLTAETDCFEELIYPNLRQGNCVIGDRWLMSGRVYQSFLKDRPPESINKLIDAAIPHPWGRPDLYIVLNAQPETLLARVVAEVEKNREEQLKKVKDKGAKEKKEEMAQEADAERQALEGRIDFYRCAWAAYEKSMVFSDGVPCVRLDTTEMDADAVYDKVREIVQQGVLSV